VALRALDKVVNQISESHGLEPELLKDLSAGSHGLDNDGERAWDFGDYLGVVRLTHAGRVKSAFYSLISDRWLASTPRAVRESHFDELHEMRLAAKELRGAYATQRGRLEEAMVGQRAWSLQRWDEVFRSNPLMWQLAHRLVWVIKSSERLTRSTSTDPLGEGAGVKPHYSWPRCPMSCTAKQ